MISPRVEALRRLKPNGERIASLTAYDYPTARLLEEAKVDFILVGDSLGMVVLGYETTSAVTMEDILHHTRAVRRGAPSTLVVADLPFGSYETAELAVTNAKRLVEAGSDAVKLEGGMVRTAQLTALASAGVPVMGHIGMLPQSVKAGEGYRLHGKSDAEAASLLADAEAVERAGAFAVVLELVQPEVARRISTALRIPTVGIGSGQKCDGQILVSHDLFGMFPWFTPKHAQPRARVGEEIRAAAASFIAKTKSAS